jgi:hypothetical protein
MNRFLYWKSGTAAVMAMAITTGTIVPLFAPVGANAQTPELFNRSRVTSQSRTVSIPRGVRIPVTYEKDRILVTPNETSSLKLTVARNIVDRNGNLLIPEGTEIEGQLEPATARNGDKGSRYVAKELVFRDGRRQTIDATSQIVTRKETIKKGAKTGTILTDAAIGAGAASVISLITGNRKIEVLEPIAGGAAGALASVLLRRREVEVVSIDPQRDLDLTLESNLLLSRY